MDEEQTRTSTRELIARIITPGASRERMEAMLVKVYKDEAWPAIWVELAELEREGGGGS